MYACISSNDLTLQWMRVAAIITGIVICMAFLVGIGVLVHRSLEVAYGAHLLRCFC